MTHPPISIANMGPRRGYVRKLGIFGPAFPRVPRVVFDIDPLRATEMAEDLGFLRSSVRKEMCKNPNYLDYWLD